jgi:hypothetical protein
MAEARGIDARVVASCMLSCLASGFKTPDGINVCVHGVLKHMWSVRGSCDKNVYVHPRYSPLPCVRMIRNLLAQACQHAWTHVCMHRNPNDQCVYKQSSHAIINAQIKKPILHCGGLYHKLLVMTNSKPLDAIDS